MSMLLTALAIEGADGQFVDLLVPNGRGVSSVDGLIGMEVREKIRPRPGRRGIINTSRYSDAPPITITGHFEGATVDQVYSHYNTVARALAAAVRTNRSLRWTGGSVLNLVETKVRLVSMKPPLEVGPNLIRYQLVLRPADPRSFAQTPTAVDGSFLSASGGGLSFPITFPITFTPAGGSVASFVVGGTDDTPPVFRIYGFATNPSLRLLSTGEQIFINGQVDAGRFLVVDVDAREVRLDDGTPRNNLFDFERSSWFELPPGPQTVQMFASNFDATAHPQIWFSAAFA